MKKLIAFFIFFTSLSLSAQPLFTYGKEAVSASDFVKAFKKNSGPVRNEKALREYLDLYISSRLKIKHARDLKLDTLTQIKSELLNLRQQILPGYVTDNAQIQQLVDEAFLRSQKDIKVSHIFIGFKSGSESELKEARKKLELVIEKLNKGISIDQLAQEYSDDPSAKVKGASLGWITVFSLPYELENVVYNIPVGKISPVFESNSGYHILMNNAERKAAGRIKAAQILLAFPEDTDAAKKVTKDRADSLYTRIAKGDDFGKLATLYSNDVVSAASNGNLTEFGVGEYDPFFETAVYGLKEGEVSKPFLTSYGYHIVKLLQKLPVITNQEDKVIRNFLQEKIEQGERMNSIKKFLAENVISKTSVKVLFKEKDITIYTDSLLNSKNNSTSVNVQVKNAILQFDNKKIFSDEWLQFVQENRYRVDGSGAKSYTVIWKEFKEAKALEYYYDHLEKFNPVFREQMNEIAEGNLFFEVMQRKVWTPAQRDSVALFKYYQKNKQKYTWKQSADAIIFYVPDITAGNHLKGHLGSLNGWRSAIGSHSEVTTDSSRFEWNLIPGASEANFKAGSITNVVANGEENNAAFAYIVNIYPQPSSRSFVEAKGLVISDYQNELEKQWLLQLKKKYPVIVNQKVLNDLVKSDKWK